MKRLVAAFSLFCVGLVPTAMAQSNMVNHLTMNQWVRVSDSGQLKGRVFLPQLGEKIEALEGVDVAISSRDGEIIRGKSNAKGEFVVEGINPGVYALTARGDNVFACCAMHVVDSQSDKYPEIADISLANVDYTTVNTAVIRYMPPKAKTDFGAIESAQLDGLANLVCGEDLFRVAQSAGGMRGRLHLAGANGVSLAGVELTNVFLFKNGMELDRTLTDEEGKFSFASVAPGQYSILAVGASGVGLMGFELVDESKVGETAALTGNDASRLVGFRHKGRCCEQFSMQVAPMPEVVCCVEEVIEIVEDECHDCEEVVIEEEIIDEGMCCPLSGAGYAGYGGGGGGGAGAGGWGGLAALAGLAAVAAAIGNDDSGIIIASPVAP